MEDKIALFLTKKEWEVLSNVLCWARSFEAGLPEDEQNCKPYGIRELIELNIKLKRALEDAR